eukprot:Polyplicarium_translucidae@DN3383_c0_g1_i7.p1
MSIPCLEALVSRYVVNGEGQGGTHPLNLQGGTHPLNLQGGTQLYPLNVSTSSATDEQPLDFSQQSTTNVWKGGQGAAGGSCRTPSPTMSAPSPSGVRSSEKAPKHTDIHREEFECKICRKVLSSRRSHGEHEKSHT